MATGLAPQLVRPEWLFEVAQRVQGFLVVHDSPGSPTLDRFLEECPPQSSVEDQLVNGLIARLQALQRSRGALGNRGAIPGDVASCDGLRTASLEADVERARQILLEDVASHWTVEALARRVGRNRTHLEMGFQRRYGHSVHAYLVSCRLDVAKRLLRKSAWRIEEIAKAAGWRSKVSLYEQFRRVLRMTPDEYRQRWTPMAVNDHVRELLSRLDAAP